MFFNTIRTSLSSDENANLRGMNNWRFLDWISFSPANHNQAASKTLSSLFEFE